MEFNLLHFAILSTVIIGAGYTSFKIGVRHGAESMFDFLYKTGEPVYDNPNSVTVVLNK
jgi:hypothetical protein